MTSQAGVALPLPSAIESPPDAVAKAPRLRLEYLDGVRGLAALYVVLGHIFIALTFFSPTCSWCPRSRKRWTTLTSIRAWLPSSRRS